MLATGQCQTSLLIWKPIFSAYICSFSQSFPSRIHTKKLFTEPHYQSIDLSEVVNFFFLKWPKPQVGKSGLLSVSCTCQFSIKWSCKCRDHHIVVINMYVLKLVPLFLVSEHQHLFSHFYGSPTKIVWLQ